jgi:hypothetical protein
MFFWIPACAGMTRNAPFSGLGNLGYLGKMNQRFLFSSTLAHFSAARAKSSILQNGGIGGQAL